MAKAKTAAEIERSKFYASSRWRKCRRVYLAKNPLCVRCLAAGRIEPARHVHHIVERLDDPSIAFDVKNFEALCPSCHSRHHGGLQASQERVQVVPATSSKQTISIDFNGVLHDHHATPGGKYKISPGDPAIPGAIEFIEAAVEVYSVAITSASFARPGRDGLHAMASARDWLIEKGVNPSWITIEPDRSGRVFLTGVKLPVHVVLDDRAMHFNGVFPQLADLINFKPWNQ